MLVAAVLAGLATGVGARDAESQYASVRVGGPQAANTGIFAVQVFALAENSRAKRDFARAEIACRAFIRDPSFELRAAAREAVRDSGFSLVSGGAGERRLMYPERRVQNRQTVSFAGTWRAVRLGGFAPQVHFKRERNRSSIEIYDYRRVAAEFGVTSAV